MMKKYLPIIIAACAVNAVTAQTVTRVSGNHAIVSDIKGAVYLPIEDSAPESQLRVVCDNERVATHSVRLAQSKVDYTLKIDLSRWDNVKLDITNCYHTGTPLWVSGIKPVVRDIQTSEKPKYHFAPLYGWMNDPNGMFYINGEWHLFYQHNPYGSVWGNMHWGHAVSKDLLTWEHLPEALEPDAWGAVFSGSCVVDRNNTSGLGPNTVFAFYTGASDSQLQCLAVSKDGGRTFEKYAKNPIITSTDPDFRDPKVMWHEASGRWVMIVSAGQQMKIYSSANLLDWQYESAFGRQFGAHGGVWECPDLVKLPVRGTKDSKWVLICNINPGGPFGGSATQYFVGDFDGKTFKCDDAPTQTLWMDYGKDHYATVTWSNAPDNRCVALAWMSNWQYADKTPTVGYRSEMSLPRELSLIKTSEGLRLYVEPVKEALSVEHADVVLNEKNCVLTVGKATIKADFKSHTLSVIRPTDKIASEDFTAVTAAPIDAKAKRVHIKVFADAHSIEVFNIDNGTSLTNLIF